MNTQSKVVIFGSYTGTSIGDTAILLGLLSSFESVYGKSVAIEVLVRGRLELEKQAKDCGIDLELKETDINEWRDSARAISCLAEFASKALLRIFKRPYINLTKINRAFSRASFLVIGGGNLIMDLYPKWPVILSRVCSSATKYGVPYSFFGVGAGPINTYSGCQRLKQCIRNAQHIYVRDKSSLDICKKRLDIERGQVVPDLALSLRRLHIERESSNHSVLVNVAAVYSPRWPEKDFIKFQCYISAYVELVARIASQASCKKIILFSSNWSIDSEGVRKFVELFNSRHPNIEVVYARERNTVRSIISLATGSRIAIVTRLHAGIMAALGGCKVYAVAYQPKVCDVLLEANLECEVIAIEELIESKGLKDMTIKGKCVPDSLEQIPVHEKIDSCLKQLFV